MAGKNKVLIADDAKVDRIALRKILGDIYEVIEAEDGQQALEILEAQTEFDTIAAVLLDLVMPKMGGLEFMEEYRKVESYHGIPVIIATVDKDVNTERECLKLGAWDFVSKPYDAAVIQFRLRNAIERSEQQLSRELRYRADYDMLTGIYNKTKFFEVTRAILNRNPSEKFVLLRMDIEKFQLVNSFFGSSTGDGLLCYIAGEIRRFAGETSKVSFGRIEADIFGICMPYPGEEALVEFVKYMRMRLGQYALEFDVVPTVGMYVIEEEERKMPVDRMYDRALLAAKQCKGNYINNYAFYTEDMRDGIVREQQIVNHMRKALADEEFVIYLQPKYSLQDNKLCGAEALVRWQKPSGEMISPGEFIPVFERNGFVIKLDYYVWEKTCALIAKWLAEGRMPAPVSVNISRVSMYNPKLVEWICGLTDKYQIPRELLQLELTESAYTTNPKAIKETMERLQREGFSILMDDFGSGYSSLNVLKDIAVDILKIDMKFLSDTEKSGRGENILASVVRMAKWLDLPVVAEGVERREQVDFLHSVGCEYVQGYYFARPMPVADYEELAFSKDKGHKEQERAMDAAGDSLWTATAQMEGMFSGMLDAAGIYEYDEESRSIGILRANNAYYDLFGYGDINTFGRKDSMEAVQEEGREELLETFDALIKTGEMAECEFMRRLENGRWIWVHLKLKYITKVGGKHIIVGTISDVTQQKKMDQELQKYRQALHAAEHAVRTILVVDDEEANRVSLRCILEEHYQVLEAGNGAEALSILAEHSGEIALILLDLRMPVMDGLTFLERKSKDSGIAGIPVIVITADDTTRRQLQTLELGAEDYIVKPFVPEIAFRRVEHVIGLGRLMGQLVTAGEKGLEGEKI